MSATTMPPERVPGFRLLLFALLPAALALRVYRLDFQSLWSDEGISLYRAKLPVAEMLAQMPAEHTPGYFLLLRAWISVAGSSDFALRFLSVLPAVAAVALIYRLAADLGSPRAGLLAALMLTLSPFHVWYAQEARMYTWLLASGLLATVTVWRLLVLRGGWGVWALYVLSTTATLYFHFFGFLVPLVHSVYALARVVRRQPSDGFIRWVLAGGAVTLLFAPWLARAVALLHFQGWRTPMPAERALWESVIATGTSGFGAPAGAVWYHGALLLIALAGLVLWGLLRREAAWFLGLATLTALAVVLLLVVRQPDFHVRYAIFIVALLNLLVAGGLAMGNRYVLPGALVLIGVSVSPLQAVYFDPGVHKPDYRAAVARINQSVAAGDLVLIDGPNPDLVVRHYYRGAPRLVDVGYLEHAPWEMVDARLRAETQDKQRAWVLLFFHPPAQVQLWLATRAWASAPTYHNGIRVSLYGLDGPELLPRAMNLDFGPHLTLLRAAVQGPSVARGELLRVTTTWHTHAPPPDYKFSLRLLDGGGAVRHADDYVPQDWFAPTPHWIVGAGAEDRRALLLPADLPPGPYRVTMRLYDTSTGQAVETNAGQDVLLGEVEVLP